jgi:hypothetical protein
LSHIELGAFLRNGAGPEHKALLRLIGTLVDVPPNGDRPQRREAQMDLYRVWLASNQNNFYWTRGNSEIEAIEIVSLAFDIPETDLKAAPDADAQHDIRYGVILGSDGKPATTRRD